MGTGECFCFDDLKGQDCSLPLTEAEKKVIEDEIWGKRTSEDGIVGHIAMLMLISMQFAVVY